MCSSSCWIGSAASGRRRRRRGRGGACRVRRLVLRCERGQGLGAMHGIVRYPFALMTRELPLVVALALSGCDSLYGVRRSAPIQTEPDVRCIERVIRSAPGVVTVQHQQEEDGRPLTWSGIQAPTIVHTFIYQGPENIWGALQYTKDYKGSLKYSQVLVRLNRPPPQERVTATRPVMRYIERGIDERCGMKGLSSINVTEWCAKVSCPPLQP